MSSVARKSHRGKKKKVLRKMDIPDAATFAAMQLDTKTELIKALIPLGLMAVAEMLDAEVTDLAGKRYGRGEGRPGLVRHGTNPGGVDLAGQHVAIRIPRVRNHLENAEVPLQAVDAMRGTGEVNEVLMKRVLYGISCRNYEAASELVPGAIGLSSSSISREFIRGSAEKLRELQERDLSEYDIVAMVIDGKTFAEDTMVTSIGITMEGRKVVLGIVQAGTENATVLTQFLEGLLDRGLLIDEGILVVIDGAKGIRAAVKRVFGKKAEVQRCQWHKRENVVAYLPKSEQPLWRRRIQAAYSKPTYEEAKAALLKIRAQLEERNQSAAASLDEGFEETLTLHRLGVFQLLGRSLKTTNCIESIHSQVQARCSKVSRRRNSSRKQRRLATSLLDIEPRLRRIMGYRHLPLLREAIQKELGLVGQQQVA
jgi:putative transposase